MMETEYKDGKTFKEFFDSLPEVEGAAREKLNNPDVRSVKITKLIPGKRRRRK